MNGWRVTKRSMWGVAIMVVDSTENFKFKVELINRMLSPIFDWGAHFDDGGGGLSEVAKSFVRCVTGEELGDYWWCGNFAVDDTPKSLYRALWLFSPSVVDFSDMYKKHLFSIVSSDGRFACEFRLFKYELGVYCYAPKGVVSQSESRVTAGHPSADNGHMCNDAVGRLFFETVEKMINSKIDVYSGNNFEV